MPTATPAPVSGTTWNDGVAAIMEAKCISCHGPAAMGGLDLSSYASTMSGGASGVVVIAEDPDASLIVSRQTEGGHPGQFSQEEIDFVIEWIAAGAPKE